MESQNLHADYVLAELTRPPLDFLLANEARKTAKVSLVSAASTAPTLVSGLYFSPIETVILYETRVAKQFR
jgi:hypothetical protein